MTPRRTTTIAAVSFIVPCLIAACAFWSEAPAVREVNNPGYAIQDRCMTCHMPTEDRRPEAGPSPDRFHSPALLAAHPVDDLGCAVCHGGDGLSTMREVAHGRGEAGGKTLLTGVLVQSRCVRCHEDLELPGTEVLREGLALIDDYACFACHEIPGSERRERIAPTLGNIANKVHSEWLTAWLTDPKGYFDAARMPSYYLTGREALAITTYLMTLPGRAPESPAPGEPVEFDRVQARRLLKQSACLDCHTIRGTGGSPGIRAPDLSRIGDKVKAIWLAEWLQGPQHLEPGAGMPAFRFTNDEAITLARYLTGTLTSMQETAVSDKRQPATRRRLADEGRRVVEELGCMNCHGAAGEKPTAKMGPDLREVGDRDVQELEWGDMEPKWDIGLVSYLRAKVSTPRAFNSNHKMPNFSFTPDETEAIVVALLSFSRNPIPVESRLLASKAEPSLGMPTGPAAAVFRRYQCFACHALRGAYGELAPDLGWEGDKVWRDWLVRFLRNPYLIRPALDARMPNFGMTDEETEIVADYIEATWWDDEVPPDPFLGDPPPRELVAAGRDLFWNEYPCLDCHQVEGEGEEEGPALDRVGDRLQPGWTYQWVIDPQRFYENEMEEQGVTEEDALALTAYLMSLRLEEFE